VLIFIGIAILMSTSIKNSGFFSKQTFLFVLGIAVPIIVNILGTFKIISMTVYLTPILYTFTSLCFAIAIVKYKALSITPVAFKTVINTMSDSFIVISDTGDIVDFNTTFDNTLGRVLDITKEGNLFDILSKNKLIDVNDLKKHIIQTRKNKSIITEEYNIKSNSFNRCYEVDIHPIKASKAVNYIGTLLLFKDVTQHKIDLQAIKDKQDVIVKQGQLVSIGELAGGVAHDINTPISGIKTGLQMLTEMDTPRSEVETELLYRMTNCADKIIKIVNSMRNQIRNLGSDQMSKFKISTVIEDIRIIAYNEIQKNHCELIVNIVDDVSVYGDPTKLGQVFTNLIVNAVQAYDGKGGKVEIIVTEAPNNKVMIRVKDYAGGIPENIKEFVFKNILTTKGTKGTGLGLYLAYSVIKGEFSGEISFDSKVGKGTTFIITLNKA
ncbi:MAG: ATP-binding protein, partial [Clostridia bacterium]